MSLLVHTIFFLQHPWKFHFVFKLTPGNSTCYFFESPGNSLSSTPPPPPCLVFLCMEDPIVTEEEHVIVKIPGEFCIPS